MKKVWRKILLLGIASLSLSGCTLTVLDIDFNFGGEIEEEQEVEEPNFNIKSYLDRVDIEITNIGQHGYDYKVVALPSYQYFKDEAVTGLAFEENIGVNPIEIGTYHGGEIEVISLDHNVSGMEANYLKYYLLSNDGVMVAGPRFVTSFEEHVYDHELIKAINKKGLMHDNFTNYEPIYKLGISWGVVNLCPEYLLVPNEVVMKDQATGDNVTVPINWEMDSNPEDDPNGYFYIKAKCPDGATRRYYVDSYELGGKTYYIRMYNGDPKNIEYGYSLSGFDDLFKTYTNPDKTKYPDAPRTKFVANILWRQTYNQYITPYYLFYPGSYSASGWSQMATNNEYGFAYTQVLYEVLAKRYLSPANEDDYFEHGEVSVWIVGNEIDYDSDWNAIVPQGAARLSLEDYLEEHERCLRIANNAVKKYHSDSMVCSSFTHNWDRNGVPYKPKDMINYLCSKTKLQGNYDWGFSCHPYCTSLGEPSFIDTDYRGGYVTNSFTTGRITWTNLEVLNEYLSQDSKRCNGKIRKIFITEGGISSYSETEKVESITKGYNLQAAGVAYAYMKAAVLECVGALCYYRFRDHPDEPCYFGLYDRHMQQKLAYNVYKWVDTQYSDVACRDYLKYIEWKDPYTRVDYGVRFGNINNWFDTMNVVGSTFDFESVWDYDGAIANRIVSEQY